MEDVTKYNKSYHESHFREVIEPNRKHAQHFIWQLRELKEQIVIDPTALPPISDWKQEDWRSFWRQVIERYVSTVFLINDWQYSNGCVYEFWVAQKNGIPTLNEDKHIYCGATKSLDSIIYRDNTSKYHEFKVEQGLEALRELISNVSNQDEGIILVGDVGITSHFGDVLRRAEIPSKIISHNKIATTKI